MNDDLRADANGIIMAAIIFAYFAGVALVITALALFMWVLFK